MSRTASVKVALLLCLGPAAGSPGFDTVEMQLRAVGSGTVWEYTESGVTRYYIEEGDVRYGQWYSVYPPAQGNEHGTTAFDLSPIPDTALVTGAEFGFFQYTDDTAGTPPYDVRVYDYAGQDPESLFDAVDTAAAVSYNYEAHHGWNRVPLIEAGVTALRSRLVINSARLAVAEDAWGELGYAYGCPAPETLRPYLLVSYLPTAVKEESETRLGSGLVITPNPCSRTAAVRLSSLRPAPYSLSVYDASGRLVYSQPVSHSPFAIRTSSFPAGVYVARCASGSRVVSARLTVRHR